MDTEERWFKLERAGLGLNAREMYVAGVIGIGLTPDALIRKLDEEAGR